MEQFKQAKNVPEELKEDMIYFDEDIFVSLFCYCAVGKLPHDFEDAFP